MSKKQEEKHEAQPLKRGSELGSDLRFEIGTRIEEVANAVGSDSALARMCNVSPSVIGKWRSGKSEPTATKLVALARAGKVTVEWLATGTGPMRHGLPSLGMEDYVAVPLYDIRSLAEQGNFAEARAARQSIIVPNQWPLQRAGVTPEKLAFIHMHGDAMKPTLHDGDLLLIERTDAVLAKAVYVYFVDGFLFIQRLARVAGKIVTFIEEDPARAPSSLPDLTGYPERSGIYGRVVWAGRRF